MEVKTYKTYKCGICGREFKSSRQCAECEARCSSGVPYVRYRLQLTLYENGRFATEFKEVGDFTQHGTLHCGPSRVCSSFAPGLLDFEYLKRKDDPKPSSQVLEETLVYAKEWLGKFARKVSGELKKLKGGKDAESN